MGNKRRTYTIVAILLAVVALGIGYAAVSTLLTINGSATALQSDGVKLEFTGTPTNSGTQSGNSAAIDSSDSTVATCTVVLKNMNESATCSYTVTNTTTDTSISAKDLAVAIFDRNNAAWTSSSSTYFTITSAVGASTLANGASTTVTVTVTLKKENTTGSDITETFTVKVNGDTQQS